VKDREDCSATIIGMQHEMWTIRISGQYGVGPTSTYCYRVSTARRPRRRHGFEAAQVSEEIDDLLVGQAIE
jgi:hypothetical protein